MLVSALWLAYGLKSQPPAWYWGVVLVVLVDLAGVNRSQFRYRSPQSVLAEGEPAASYLAAHAEGYRVYSPSYSLPQQTAASLGLELASGVDPLQLRSYANFMTEASGVSQVGYSVTLPPVQSHPESDNARFSPSPVLLGLLNVGSIASEFDIQVEGLDRINLSGDTRLYANRFARPRAWVQGGDAIDSAYIPAGEIRWSPNRIEITAQGPGTLVLSEIAYPGWRVWVDGMENDLATAYSILRSVHLGAGEHRVVFAYQPASLYAGLSLCLIAILVLAGWSYASRR